MCILILIQRVVILYNDFLDILITYYLAIDIMNKSGEYLHVLNNLHKTS